MTNIDIEKLFDKYLYITAQGEKYKVYKENMYINNSSSFYGQKYIITSDKLNNNNLYILRKIYSLEDNRLRYSYEVYTNVKLVKTIEKKDNNIEESILVIESYDEKKVLIGSIGNIKRIDSDILDETNNTKNNGNKILRFLKPNINNRKVA